MAAYIEFLVTVQVYIVGLNYYLYKLFENLVTVHVSVVRFSCYCVTITTPFNYIHFLQDFPQRQIDSQNEASDCDTLTDWSH